MKYTLNLATGTYVNHRRFYVIISIFSLLLLALLAFNGVQTLRSVSRSHQLDLRIETLRREQQGTRPQGEISAGAIATLAQKITVANELLVRDNYRWTALLDQLEAQVGEGISIRGLQPDYKTGLLKLNGVALSLLDLRHFIDNLSRSREFTHVYLQEQRTEKSNEDENTGIAFSIVLQKREGA